MSRRDRGFVLVNALILVAAVSGLSLAVLRGSAASLDRAGAQEAADRAEAGIVAGRRLAARLLAADARAGGTDRLDEAWALADYRTDLDEGATVALWVTDLQGRFNLNLLLRPDSPAAEAVFRRLATAAGVAAGAQDAILAHYALARPAMASPVVLPPGLAYRNEALALPEEIAGIAGADAARALAPLVSTLPEAAGINLGTAGREVLAAIVGVDDRVAWDAFAAERRAAPFATPPDAFAAIERAWGEAGSAASLMQDLIVLQSQWFEARVESVAPDAAAAARLVLLRAENDGAVTLVARVPEDPR